MKRLSKQTISDIKQKRTEGYSIPQLVEYFEIPKTTIWHHVQGVEVATELLKKIRSKQGGSKVRSKVDWTKAEVIASKILRDPNLRELAIQASMLYWAEGSKRQLTFTNTDPDMLRIYLSALQTLFKISVKDIKLLIRICDPIQTEKAINYWRDELSLVKENISIDHNNKQNRTKTFYGICRITVVKSGFYHKVIQCMISQQKKPL